ncbi:MAG: phage tail protein [Nitrospira sp.]
MAVISERPYRNSNFLVDVGRGDSRSLIAGFAEVIFPDFIVDQREGPQRPHTVPQPVERAEAAAANRLVLKRGVMGSMDLYAWWDEARKGRAPRPRTVKVDLLGEDQSTVVLTWRFDNVRPVSLSYSPLRAMDSGILMETIVLEFDRMEMM